MFIKWPSALSRKLRIKALVMPCYWDFMYVFGISKGKHYFLDICFYCYYILILSERIFLGIAQKSFLIWTVRNWHVLWINSTYSCIHNIYLKLTNTEATVYFVCQNSLHTPPLKLHLESKGSKKMDGVKGIVGLLATLPGCPSLFSYNKPMWKHH